MPLAARVRPRSLDEFLGQRHALRENSPLRKLLTDSESKYSVLLYGPPGSGKTTLANLIAKASDSKFVELSAVSATIKDVRDAISQARDLEGLYNKRTFLFVDEIHRFNKTQQDALLPAVENGWVSLIAATTENPSFAVVSPLLSRVIQIELSPHDDEDLVTILENALNSERGLGAKFKVEGGVLSQIARLAAGDARKALTLLEALADSASGEQLTLDGLTAVSERAFATYDRDGDSHYDIISAFIKSVRGSDADAAIYWLARMIEGGEDPRFIARRLMIIAAEDVGLADAEALSIAAATAQIVERIGMPEGRIPLAECTIYLALAPKSNAAYRAINEAIEMVREGGTHRVPLPLRSSNYAGAKKRGLGVGYLYPHDFSPPVISQQYGPDSLDLNLVRLGDQGEETRLAKIWNAVKTIIRPK
ncbi:MAG: hypothetical protein RI933_135 [Actinomycetota bacterium]